MLGGLIFLEEINLQLADARRSMSNQNLAADDAGQLLRKNQCALIGNCIHEMFVDVRLRDMCDVWVRCKDTALTSDGLANAKEQGEYINWQIYPNSDKLTGLKFSDNGIVVSATFNFKPWHGCYDTMQRQEREKWAIKPRTAQGEQYNEEFTPGTLGEPAILREKPSKWEEVEKRIIIIRKSGKTEAPDTELWPYLFEGLNLGLEEPQKSPVVTNRKTGLLVKYGIKKGRRDPKGIQYYDIEPAFELENMPTKKPKTIREVGDISNIKAALQDIANESAM